MQNVANSLGNSFFDLSDDVILEILVDQTGKAKGSCGLKWDYSEEFGFQTILGKTKFTMSHYLNRMGHPEVYIIASEGGRERTIFEPPLHISQTPAGAFLRALTSLFWFKSLPQVPEGERQKTKLRNAIQDLYKMVGGEYPPFPTMRLPM